MVTSDLVYKGGLEHIIGIILFCKQAASALFLQYIQRMESPISSLNAIKNEINDLFPIMPPISYPLDWNVFIATANFALPSNGFNN